LLAILRYHFSQVWINKEKKIEQGRELGLHAREENKQCGKLLVITYIRKMPKKERDRKDKLQRGKREGVWRGAQGE